MKRLCCNAYMHAAGVTLQRMSWLRGFCLLPSLPADSCSCRCVESTARALFAQGSYLAHSISGLNMTLSGCYVLIQHALACTASRV